MGLMGDGERKSMEPIAARACPDPDKVNAQHLRLQNFITESPWDDHEVRKKAAEYCIPAMTRDEPISHWIVDDTGFLKQGKHSVAVKRQSTTSMS
ncbi:MAG: transposase [Proteobacteria bacterium]|nr:transposase [Pseudomonadota bacterium]